MSATKNGAMRSRQTITVTDQLQAERCAKGRVVLIDDEPAILSVLAALLEQEGYACESYSSALDYLNVLAFNKPQFPGPSCVFCDVRMPVVDGLELQRRLMNMNDVPLVLMSGASGIHEAVSAFRAGVLDFLVKPFEVDIFLDTVAKALASNAAHQAQLTEKENLLLRVGSLTKSELEVVRRVAMGEMNREIAETLGIALRTVKLHRQHALAKLGVEKAVDLARLLHMGVF